MGDHEASVFSGFSRDTVRFFKELGENNSRPWFEAHRELFETAVMAPAKAFVAAMGEKLREAVPGIVAAPQVNKSIFRIYRDTRFSLDPSPYKTNLGLYFWDGVRPRMESCGFYVHLEPPTLLLGAGVYLFPDRFLERFRRAAVDPKLGRELAKILTDVRAKKGWLIGGQHYKRLPAGYDASHPNAEILKHTGLHVGRDGPIPQAFYSARFVEYCFERFVPFVPLHRWLVKILT